MGLNLWDFLTIVVIFGIVAEVVRHRQRHAGARLSDEVEDRIADLEAENDALRERVATLEAIVTDEKYALQRELKEL